MKTIQDKTIDKIRKLLLKSNSTDSEAEQQALFQKAQSIALQHDLDLELATIQNESVVEEKQPFEEGEVYHGKLPTISKWVLPIIVNHFQVKDVYHTRNRKTKLSFVGRKDKVEIAKDVYDRLLKTYDWLWKNYKAENGLDNRCKGSYLYGLYTGLNEKMKEEKEKTIRETIERLPEPIRGSVGNKLELAIITEGEELENALSKRYPSLGIRRTQYKTGNRADVFQDGKRAGRNINTGQKQLALC
jgi:hypothetical protein